MRKILVVDAGSTNYTKRVVFEDGRMEAVENELGEMTTPASILIGKEDGDEYIFIGRNAKDQSVITPENYFCSWKREMGSEKVIRSIAGKDYTPVTLTAIMLKQMKKEAEEYCGCELSEILITMPVEYSETQKKALVDAAVIAGFEKDKVHIRLESDAAVRSADARNDFRGTIACLDCGGNTLDCTVCEVTNDEIRALFTKGDLNFAGKEFDRCMADLVREIITKKIEESEVDEQKKKELMKALNSLDKFSEQDLMLKCEMAKEELSKKQKTSFSLVYDGQAYVEEKYLDLIFLKDGERYTIEDKNFMIIGGGYSKDFFERVLRGYGYWYDEQLSDEEFQKIAEKVAKMTEDTYVLSHMLPIKWSPGEDDHEVDKQARRTEVWLQKIADILGEHLLRWYAGHYHMDVAGEQYEIVYNEIKKLE